MADEGQVLSLPLMFILHLCLFLTTGKAQNAYDNRAFDAGEGNSFSFGEARPSRYLLYDVNPGEGFNLRRDVYMRVANLVKFLNEDEPWILVLPPWGHLYHWRSKRNQFKIKWSTFFDVQSLSRHVPVIEFEDYLKVRGEGIIDEIYYLQRYKEGWTSGRWEEKLDVRDCLDKTGFDQLDDGEWESWFFGYETVKGLSFKCLSVQAESVFLKSFIQKNTTGMCVMIHRMEHLLHPAFGQTEYWTARRSMVFAEHLRAIGDDFRKSELDSTDESDNTILDDDWTQMERKHGEAIGGAYLAVHLRRQDFLYGHSDDVPTVRGAASQIKDMLIRYNLTTVFIATDAPKSEYTELKGYLKDFKVTKYNPTGEVMDKYMDGGVAIIDQWIAAHARVFVGTTVSTFSFRIHEEREIMGFAPETTFNCLCSDKRQNCDQPTKWKIKY